MESDGTKEKPLNEVLNGFGVTTAGIGESSDRRYMELVARHLFGAEQERWTGLGLWAIFPAGGQEKYV